MNTLLWIGQGLLALAFLYSGFCKAVFSKEKLLAIGQTGAGEVPFALTRFIGIAELLGGIGILLPWAIGVLLVLTSLTAICFALIMILAARVHYKLHEPKNIFTNVVLFLVSIFVAWADGIFKPILRNCNHVR